MRNAAAGSRAHGVPLLAGLAALLIIVPFLFWRDTWFGRPLGRSEIRRYLEDNARPRRIQQALSQIADRIVSGDASVREWYPRVVALARHPAPEIRTTAAWVMGQDNRSEAFHQALLGLLTDSDVFVRRNAALALVRFQDSSGRPELVAVLRSYTGAAGQDQAWEALRALYLVGRPEDLVEVERCTREQEHMPDRIRRQAALTAQAIRTRSERSSIR